MHYGFLWFSYYKYYILGVQHVCKFYDMLKGHRKKWMCQDLISFLKGSFEVIE